MTSRYERRLAESKAANHLPSPTGTALAILELTRREDSSAHDIARVIKADPAFCGRLLKFANSPYVGLSRPVASIENAVILLGVRVVRQLSLGLSVLSDTLKGPCKNFDYATFWSRSLATALATRALSAREHLFPPEEAFVCGLLCQVGCLALASIYPDSYAEILATAADEDPKTLTPLERKYLSTDHNELTAVLLEDWGLPTVHIDAVLQFEKEHDSESEIETRTYILSQYLKLATHISKMCTAGNKVGAKLLPELIELAEQQKINRVKLDKLFNEVVEEWKEWGTILEVPTHNVAPFVDLTEKFATANIQNLADQENMSCGLCIVLVDDDPEIIRLVSGQLGKAGHKLITASNGREGLQSALQARPHLVITDLVLPDLDGLTLCRTLRSAQRDHPLYIIVLTTREDEVHVLEALEAGADDYIVKPFEQNLLEARVRAAERLIRLYEEVEREREKNRSHLAELTKTNHPLQEPANTDSLTKLPDRRYAADKLQTEWRTSHSSKRNLSCLMIDVDDFKRVQERYGAAIGDAVLREIAVVFRSTVRGSDLVCRFGEEKFVVLCPNTSADEALQLAERLRGAVEDLRISPNALTLTISIGLAMKDATMANPKALVKTAIRALINAKRSGRNCVCQATT